MTDDHREEGTAPRASLPHSHPRLFPSPSAGTGRRQQNQGSKIDRRDGFSVFLPSRRPPSLTVCLSGPPFSTLTPVPPSFPFVSPYALSSSCHSTFCSVPFRRDERSEGGSEVTSDRVSGERNRHGERDERWTGVTDGD